MDSIEVKLNATWKLSIFLPVPVAEQPGLNLTWSGTQKTGFVASQPNECINTNMN